MIVCFVPPSASKLVLIMKILVMLACVSAGVASYSPQRTPHRDKLYFGVVLSDAPSIPLSTPEAIVMLPPANSQLGVNITAATNRDLNDYGSLGVPQDVLDQREQAISAGGSSSGASFLLHKESSIPSETKPASNPVKTVSNVLSVVWLVVFLVGISLFMHTALQAGSKKVNLSSGFDKLARKTVENRRIDREAYVYVDGG